jgi:polyisoprenoid-binding protein YceI
MLLQDPLTPAPRQGPGDPLAVTVRGIPEGSPINRGYRWPHGDKGALVFTGTRFGLSLTPLVLALGLLGAACSTGSAPAVPAAAPPSAPTASAPGGAQAPAASAPTSAQPPAASAQPPAGRDARSDAPTAAGELRFVFEPDASQARYRAREQFVGAQLLNDAVGTTTAVSGQIVVDAAHNVVRDASRVTVDLRSLQSDQRQRDQFIQQNPLQTNQFPTAEFVPTEARGLPATLPASGTLTFQLAGDLTMRGVTRPAVWDVQAQMNGGAASGTATTRVTLADFGMEKPRVARILSIDDTIVLELDFRVATAPDSPSVTQGNSPRGT